MKYGIFDYANNRCFSTEDFEDFDDAWDYVFKNVEDTNNAYSDYYVLAL